jgi:predicted O-methyltransferase YrrM
LRFDAAHAGRHRTTDPAAYGARAVGALLRQPAEGIERIRERRAEHVEQEWRPFHYEAVDDWQEAVAEHVSAAGAMVDPERFEEVWASVSAALANRGLAMGRGAFGGWDDGDREVARAVWWLTGALRPETIVETGVARGVTTCCVLVQLDEADRGRLWSIDLPPLLERALEDEVGAAVPQELRRRWAYIRGSSRGRLPGLARRLRRIDLFVHDSMHTARNLLFELEHAWPALRYGGAVVADDVDYNAGLRRFLAGRRDAVPIVARHADGCGRFAIVLKTPADA